jgi:uncharacterized protein HemX
LDDLGIYLRKNLNLLRIEDGYATDALLRRVSAVWRSALNAVVL